MLRGRHAHGRHQRAAHCQEVSRNARMAAWAGACAQHACLPCISCCRGCHMGMALEAYSLATLAARDAANPFSPRPARTRTHARAAPGWLCWSCMPAQLHTAWSSVKSSRTSRLVSTCPGAECEPEGRQHASNRHLCMHAFLILADAVCSWRLQLPFVCCCCSSVIYHPDYMY